MMFSDIRIGIVFDRKARPEGPSPNGKAYRNIIEKKIIILCTKRRGI